MATTTAAVPPLLGSESPRAPSFAESPDPLFEAYLNPLPQPPLSPDDTNILKRPFVEDETNPNAADHASGVPKKRPRYHNEEEEDPSHSEKVKRYNRALRSLDLSLERLCDALIVEGAIAERWRFLLEEQCTVFETAMQTTLNTIIYHRSQQDESENQDISSSSSDSQSSSEFLSSVSSSDDDGSED